MKKWVEGTNIVPKMKKTQVQLAKKAYVHFAFDPFSNGIVGPIELEYQVRPVPANLSVVTFKEIFC